MRRVALFITVVFALNLFGFPANSAVKYGEKCSKAGQTATASGKKFTCIKSGKKLIWNKGVAIPKPVATPTSTQNPNVAETPLPTPTSTPTPTATSITVSAAESLQQYRDAVITNSRCNVKKDLGKSVLGVTLQGKPTYLICYSQGFWSPDPNTTLPTNYQPKVNISEFNTLTYPWKSPCDADPWVPVQWKEYEQFAIKYFGCSRPMRFETVNLPNSTPSSTLTSKSELTPTSVCKIPDKFVRDVAGNTHNVGHRSDWKFNGDFVIQVVPVQFNDFKTTKTPLEEYGKYFEYFKEMFYKMSDGNTRLNIKVPANYISVNSNLAAYDTGQTWQKNDRFSWKKLEMPRYQNDIFSAADQSIDFTGVKLTIQIVPLSVPDNYIGHGGGFRMDNVRTNEGVVPSTYIMPPANANSDNDWYGVEPYLHLHEIFHATGMLSDHLGDWEQGGNFYGTGFWGHMSGMLTDHLVWDKWLTGMLSDSQVICAKSSGKGTYWLKPATYFGQYEKLLVVPISETKVIAIESQRAAGINFKLTKESQGALVYTLDVMDTRYDGGFEVIKPKNRTSATVEGPFIFWDAPLKSNESVDVWGYRISVVEAGDFGDVIKVEKL